MIGFGRRRWKAADAAGHRPGGTEARDRGGKGGDRAYRPSLSCRALANTSACLRPKLSEAVVRAGAERWMIVVMIDALKAA
jgi:hypothetical protein